MLSWLFSADYPTDEVSNIFLNRLHFTRFALVGSGETLSFYESLLRELLKNSRTFKALKIPLLNSMVFTVFKTCANTAKGWLLLIDFLGWLLGKSESYLQCAVAATIKFQQLSDLNMSTTSPGCYHPIFLNLEQILKQHCQIVGEKLGQREFTFC